MSVGVVSNILKNKDVLLNEKKIKNIKKIVVKYSSKTMEVILFDWFVKKKSKNIIITNDMVKIMALKIAFELNYDSFKSSNGCLGLFKKRYNISSKSISGEESLLTNRC
ncbi:Tigger transposable element-derived protein 6 [Dictyocoela muelleri]|nr:Tigger transposable element-derived protein 6 [Dictyocoela muelleri]